MAMLLAICSCNAGKPKDNARFRIVTSLYPVYVTTLNIIEGADGVSLTPLTDMSYGCMHDYAITADDLKMLEGAELLIASGMGMESFVGNISLGIHGMETLDSSEDISVILEGEDGEDNPHYWMNIDNTIEQCDKIERTLVRLDPQNADIYTQNAEEYIQKLEKLREELTNDFDSLPKSKVAVFDESMEYFTAQFGIETHKIATGHEKSAPSSQKVEAGIEYIKKNGIRVAFTTDSFDDDGIYEAVKAKTGCRIYAFDNITKETGKDIKNAYIDAMRKNATALKSAIS